MKKNIVILLLVICFSGSTLVHAGEFGSTGLMTIPTADTLRPQELELSYQKLGDADVVGVDYGLQAGVQLGAGVEWSGGLSDDSDEQVRLKLRLIEEGPDTPLISVGLMDREFYLAASKLTSYHGLRAHFGVGEKDRFRDVAFAGVSKVLNPVTVSSGNNQLRIPITTVMAEYNHGLNLGAKFDFGSGILANVGVLDFDEISAGISFKSQF